MTIERGREWGEPGTIPANVVTADDDAAVARIVTRCRRADEAIPPITLRRGDLARTLGIDGTQTERVRREPGDDAIRLGVDVGAVLVDGRLHWFVAHLVARLSWFRGPVVVAANAAFLGRWNVAPRAHPGDGRLDLLEADLSLADRFKAHRRLASGDHLPHPGITTRRVEAVQLDLHRPTPVYLDGRRVARARSLSIRVEPDALDVWV